MASIDERIRRELEQDADLFAEENSDGAVLPTLVSQAFKGPLRRLIPVALTLAVSFAVLLAWSIFEFVTATEVLGAVKWGIWAILSALALVLIELFTWMQINRVSTRREIKLLEVSLRNTDKET